MAVTMLFMAEDGAVHLRSPHPALAAHPVALAARYVLTLPEARTWSFVCALEGSPLSQPILDLQAFKAWVASPQEDQMHETLLLREELERMRAKPG